MFMLSALRIVSGKLFQSEGAACENDLCPSFLDEVCGSWRRDRLEERKVRGGT